jgi:hypothetical protein
MHLICLLLLGLILLCSSDELDALDIGDNLVVNVIEDNDEGATFWLILCINPLKSFYKQLGK